eukprot:CAMPEP_0171180394 /NCGR_PEP_ID=MMETSP0790-20130122/13734_1 /TAXON_ID=2925 /ORGANISM="Alexandrium catenella, Strain OF101" /LENGTH=165 /DNA_ID=CAMNT_0011645325 /DNA_START=50 /DNA_END=547 /DNA_ORIENTATION=+
MTWASRTKRRTHGGPGATGSEWPRQPGGRLARRRLRQGLCPIATLAAPVLATACSWPSPQPTLLAVPRAARAAAATAAPLTWGQGRHGRPARTAVYARGATATKRKTKKAEVLAAVEPKTKEDAKRVVPQKTVKVPLETELRQLTQRTWRMRIADACKKILRFVI